MESINNIVMAPSQPRNKTSSAHRSTFLRGEHRFDIVGYRARKELGVRNNARSADFQAGGCTWALICCFDDPNPYARRRGSGDQIQLVCITLQLVSNDGHDVVARASLRIDDPAPSGKKKGGPRRWPPAVWRSDEAKTFLAAAHGRGYDDDPDECTGKSYWELPVPDGFRESLYVRDDRLTIHCTVDVLQEEAGEAATKNCSVSVVPPPSILCDLRKLLDESQSKADKTDTRFATDVTFEVEQTEIRAHRLVLAMRSPVFAAELLGEMKEGAARSRVKVDDMTASTFRAMLHFIYTDELKQRNNNHVDVAMAGDLLVAADRYDLERLRLMCEKILADNMDARSVMTALMLVHGRDSCRRLEAACIEYMTSDPNVYAAVVATDEYKELKETCGVFVSDVLEKIWTRAAQPQKSASMFNSSETFKGTHEFRIPNFSAMQRRFGIDECIRSGTFQIGGHGWIIVLYPSGIRGYGEEEDQEQHIGLFLKMITSPPGADDVWVASTLKMCDPSGQLPPVFCWIDAFYTINKFVGMHKFIDLASTKSCYLGHDGSLTIHCDVSVTKEYPGTNNGTAAAAEAMTTVISVPSSNITSHLEKLLVSEQGSDVTFLVGDTKLRAHRLVVAARAPVLHKAMAAMAEPDTMSHCVRMDDIEAYVFRCVLDFIYTDELPEHLGNTTTMARDMLAAADRFGLERMKAMCENILCENVTAENVVGTLKLADRHHCQGLKDFCMEHISQAHVLGKVVETKGFKDLKSTCPSLLEEIIIKISKLSTLDG
ncbi:uncharacterized protein LOC119293048 [Triticum dicoccoides]|uniref:uncharacterized protein LOC119293048 n=1 Tax=Triticum dicoccoides TaxID=85692 RepID=UPI001890B10C|nr:uncharacterized protein LOC119293048 [Triticum dicoccoides]